MEFQEAFESTSFGMRQAIIETSYMEMVKEVKEGLLVSGKQCSKQKAVFGPEITLEQ